MNHSFLFAWRSRRKRSASLWISLLACHQKCLAADLLNLINCFTSILVLHTWWRSLYLGTISRSVVKLVSQSEKIIGWCVNLWSCQESNESIRGKTRRKVEMHCDPESWHLSLSPLNKEPNPFFQVAYLKIISFTYSESISWSKLERLNYLLSSMNLNVRITYVVVIKVGGVIKCWICAITVGDNLDIRILRFYHGVKFHVVT